jgi:hypothetical protein
VLHGSPGWKHSTLVLVAVPPGELRERFDAELCVVIDEALRPRQIQPLEQIPELDHVRDGAALVVGVVAQVAVERSVGLIQKLLEAGHGGVARVLQQPGLDLTEHGQVARIHLVIGRMPERTDGDATEGMQVQPGEDLRVPRRKGHDLTRLGLARGKRPGADLFVRGGP